MERDATRGPSFAVLLGAAWLLVAVQLMAQFWAQTGTTFPDTDDAMRLVQVRTFLAGQGWFDLNIARLAPPQGYESHWSRLIDAGLAGLFLLFRTFAAPAPAERLMSALWPVLWLIPTIGAAAAIAWRLAGRGAATVVLLLAIFGLPGMGQFQPGRIDHHNVQIALSVLAVAAAVWSDRVAWAAWACGAVTGLALAVGLESLPILALCGAALALHYLIDAATAPRLRAYGLSLAAATAAAFLVTVAPSHWTRSVCDELAINSAAAVIVAGLGIALASRRWVAQTARRRAPALSVAAGAAAAVGLLLEPRCIGGPFALMDPAIRALWLMNIAEMQSLATILRLMPLSGIAQAAFPALALAATLAAGLKLKRDPGYLVAAAAFLLALAIMVEVNKFYAYCLWLGIPLVAVAALVAFERLKLTGLVPRFALALLITPTAVTFGVMSIASAAGAGEGLDINPPERQACVRMQNYAPLAKLPVGLLVADQLEWGSYLLAWTPHAVVAAAYHRISDAIRQSSAAFALPPEEAHRVLLGLGVDYVLTCGSQGPLGLTEAEKEASLWGHLRTGDVPPWLTRISDLPEQPFAVYRLQR
jgi:hypothetical protein